MDMDMQFDGTTEEVDFTSWEREQYQFAQEIDGGNNSGLRIGYASVDPLEFRGGLDQNEVAELVALHNIHVVVAPDDYQTISGDEEPGTIDFTATVGMNLDSQADIIQPADNSLSNYVPGTVVADEEGGSAGSTQARVKSKSEVLEHFSVTTPTAFNDTANGTGGGGSDGTDYFGTSNYRELFGRGPVLGADDQLSVVMKNVHNRVSAASECEIRFTPIWDIATVDDASRQFGIPQQMG